MALGTNRYKPLDIFICKETYEPKGICYGKTCKPKNLSVKDEILTEMIRVFVNGVPVSDNKKITGRRLTINTYIAKEGFDTQTMTAYILPEGKDTLCLFASPACVDIDTLDADTKWHRTGNDIVAELPLPDNCGVEKFHTVYATGVSSETTPSHIGTADGETVSLTFDDGGLILHKTDMGRKQLIPGSLVTVSYKLKGFKELYPFTIFDFQTNIFTSATFTGCGLVEKIKVYKDPARPELGYTYEYNPVEGGIGKTLIDEWIFDTRLRFAVEYRGETRWMKTTDFAKYKIGYRVAVVKSINNAPLTPKADITQADSSETISETNDIIVSELFYR